MGCTLIATGCTQQALSRCAVYSALNRYAVYNPEGMVPVGYRYMAFLVREVLSPMVGGPQPELPSGLWQQW